ncbi:MAG: EAL domain-containing protein [Sulfuricurvum sp.]|uniref:EAL and HDOD domain-containing protein n=1 Tax=Sulfuricurvum sp. TaxID=2025608 RepID=UPI003561A0B2
MGKLYIAKQKIYLANENVYGYELLFRDGTEGGEPFPSHIKATAHVIFNTLTNLNTDALLGKTGIAFINADKHFLTSGIIDMLDKKRFVIEILETISLDDKVIERIKTYHKRGYTIALDDFDCSVEMIKKFAGLLKYIHIVKVDVRTAEVENIDGVMKKLRSIGTRFLAEKVETRAEHEQYKAMGFDMFQGYYFHRPENVEIEGYKEVTHVIILQLIKLLKEDDETTRIETFIRQRADLTYKLIKFLNNQIAFETPVESITQVITLLGRDKLLRWLLVYLYAEISTNPASKSLLQLALNRAEKMEEEAHHKDKEKAYLAGMFSLLGAVFETNVKTLMNHVNMDREISRLVIDKKGKFAASLMKIEQSEKEYLKKLVMENFNILDTVELIYTLEYSGVSVDRNKL